MSYRTTKPIIDLSTGFVRGPGQLIYPAELEPDRFNPLLAEGAIIDEDAPPPINATAAAIALAEELDLDLSSVAGTGASGRITHRDVQQHARDD